MIPAEEENTLEEFAWAFGDDAVEEMEKKSPSGYGTDP